MRHAAAPAVAAALVLLAGCGNGSRPQPASTSGPLGGLAGGGICWHFRAGQVLTYGLQDQNTSRYALTITGASLTGVRHLRLDAVYGGTIEPGSSSVIGDHYGYPPAALRKPVGGTVVPPRGYVQILFTITGDGPSAFQAGELVRYTSRGQSYALVSPWFVGIEPAACKQA
jgi:hypothetical protein